MSTQITLTVKEPNRSGQKRYNVGGGCGHCSAFSKQNSCHSGDERTGTKNACFSCPVIVECITPGTLQCSIGKNSKGQDPYVSWGGGWSNNCTFDLTKIDTVEQYNNLQSKFDLNDKQKEQILQYYCTYDTNSGCPTLPDGTKPKNFYL